MAERSRFSLDHVAIAVPHIDEVLDRLSGELGATIISGEELRGFRYALLRVGDAQHGMKLEVLEPWHPDGDNFLARFLATKGSGPHHITFQERDITGTVRQLDHAGIPRVRTHVEVPSWQETFIAPPHGCGTVIQIAGSDVEWPPMHELLAHAHQCEPPPLVPYASTSGNRFWWEPRPTRGSPAFLERIVIGVPDVADARTLFMDILGGTVISESASALELGWGHSGRIRFEQAEDPGIHELQISGSAWRGVIGGTRFAHATSASVS